MGLEPTTLGTTIRCSASCATYTIWWAGRESDPRRLALQANALPAELPAHNFGFSVSDFIAILSFAVASFKYLQPLALCSSSLRHLARLVEKMGLEPTTS